MRPCCAALLASVMGGAIAPSFAADVPASAPSDLIVTVYRAPFRSAGSFNLADLDGVALITETRTVHLPAGESRLRFEGVADGIEAASAIVTGLPSGVIEKNRDARLLSPAALVAAALGKQIELLRTNPKTGKTQRLNGTLLSNADGGVVFSSSEGIEALRCSGLPETFDFEPTGEMSARPTLSVIVRSPMPVNRQVTLSYLARGFDWSADYTATLSTDGKTLDLGAWLTLANSNGTGFPSAHTQVVAGKVNRVSGELDPVDPALPILAQCWPRGSTSDPPAIVRIARAAPFGFEQTDAITRSMNLSAAPRAEMLNERVVVTAQKKVEQEQLGDLKLYRVPDRTTVASRQSKQVRLMDRAGVPISTVYGANLTESSPAGPLAATRLVRTQNTVANHLGLPLPSGSVAVFALHAGARLLERESSLRDLAVGEDVEINMGESSDVQASRVIEKTSVDAAHAQLLPLLPGVISLRSVKVEDVDRVQISNARDSEIQFELQLQLPPGGRVLRADHALGSKNGRPIFRLQIPANGTVTVRYQTQHSG